MKRYLLPFLVILVLLFAYLSVPLPHFPPDLPDSTQSREPGDMETPLRKAYYTNMEREEVLNYYTDYFRDQYFFGIPIPTYRLNYPPEESQVLIRDQVKANWLEEIVHPLRSTFFINGYTSQDTYGFIVDGRQWKYKVTVKYIPSILAARLSINAAGVVFLALALPRAVRSAGRLAYNLSKLYKWTFR